MAPKGVTPHPLGLALGGLAALAAAVGIGRFVYTPILPLMVEDLGMTKGGAGLLGVRVGMALSAVVVSIVAVWGSGWRSLWLAGGFTSVLAVGCYRSPRWRAAGHGRIRQNC